MSITLTESAKVKLNELIKVNAEKKNIDPQKLYLRVYVAGGGCGGPQFSMALTDMKRDDDIVMDNSGITVIVDPMSNAYLDGAEVDFINHELGSRFKINAPMTDKMASACSSCGPSGGCGCC